jgi:3',5'-cyclic AMP phosphodiesterase CpdA
MRQRPFVKFLPPFVGIVSVLLLSLGWTLRGDADDRASSFTILHVTDTHLCKLEGYNAQLVKKRDHFGHGYDPLCQMLSTVPSQVGADAVVITGDMIDFYEGEAEDGKLYAGQIEHFATLVHLLKVPLWMALGNHDIQTHANSVDGVARIGGRSTTNPHAQVARAAWIRQCECFRNGTYYARDVRVGNTHWKLYFLDNGYQLLNGPSREINWGVPQLEWLENEIKQSSDQKAILFFHIPLSESPRTADAGEPQGIYKILNDHPSVVAAFCGHGHKNIVSDKIKLPAGHTITQVETAAFGYDRNAWRTIKLSENAVTVSKAGSSQMDVIIEAPAILATPATK